MKVQVMVATKTLEFQICFNMYVSNIAPLNISQTYPHTGLYGIVQALISKINYKVLWILYRVVHAMPRVFLVFETPAKKLNLSDRHQFVSI